MHLKKFKYAFICFAMVLLLALPSSTFIMRYAFAEDTDDNTISDPVVIDPSDGLPDPTDDTNSDITVDDDDLVITEESGKGGDVSAVAEKSVNVGLIVGVSVGVAAAVIAVVVIVLVVRSKNKVKPKKRKRRR